MTAKVVQVSLNQGGVPKRPVPRAYASKLGLEGDRQAHPWVHGGPKQALLILTDEAIEELKLESFPVFRGALGENITTRGIERQRFRIGMRLRIGEALVQITKARQPCKQLDVYGAGLIQPVVFDPLCKKGDPASPRWGLAGFYASVIEPGWIAEGDALGIADA